jgi:hypothetical protein
LIIIAVIVVWFVLDLLVAGGGMTGGMIGGMAGMMGTGVGPILLLVIVALLVYGLIMR